MGKIRWESAKCLINTFDEAMDCLQNDKDQFILCARDEGTKDRCMLQATKAADNQYVCEISFRNGSAYGYPGLLNINDVRALFVRFHNGEDFSFTRREWKKLQNSKSQNLLYVLVLIILSCAIFHYLHTRA